MESRSRKRGKTGGLRSRAAARVAATYQSTRRLIAGVCISVRARVRPWTVGVCTDIQGGDARRLRRMLRRAAREYIGALAVMPPEALLIVVQRVVVKDGRALAALLQVFEDGEGRKRQVVFLALSVDGREVDDDELPALLRHQLQHALADQLGRVALSSALEPPRARRAAVVPIRHEQQPPPFDDAPPPDEEFAGYDDGGFAVAAER